MTSNDLELAKKYSRPYNRGKMFYNDQEACKAHVHSPTVEAFV